MNRQFDFRAVILHIQDRLSNDDRHRLHFLVGGIIPRMQRDDVTLGGTLTLLESLFDQAVINEDYFDFLIRIFSEIKCQEAVNRLRAYQLKKEPPRERQLTITDVFDDNIQDDKGPTLSGDRVESIDLSSSLSHKPDQRKLTITDSPLRSNKPPIVVTPSRTFLTTSTALICLYTIFILQLLVLFIYLGISFRRNTHTDLADVEVHPDVYLLHPGKSLNNISGQPFDHSKHLSLKFVDRLTRIDALLENDRLYSIKFTYSDSKIVEHHLQQSPRRSQLVSKSLDFHKDNLERITQYYRVKEGSMRLAGLHFVLKNKRTSPFGSTIPDMLLDENFSNYTFGYALGHANDFLNGFQFVWYRICSAENAVLSCVIRDENYYYIITDADVYTD